MFVDIPISDNMRRAAMNFQNNLNSDKFQSDKTKKMNPFHNYNGKITELAIRYFCFYNGLYCKEHGQLYKGNDWDMWLFRNGKKEKVEAKSKSLNKNNPQPNWNTLLFDFEWKKLYDEETKEVKVPYFFSMGWFYEKEDNDAKYLYQDLDWERVKRFNDKIYLYGYLTPEHILRLLQEGKAVWVEPGDLIGPYTVSKGRSIKLKLGDLLPVKNLIDEEWIYEVCSNF